MNIPVNNSNYSHNKNKDSLRVNESIKTREVRVIDKDGEMLGVLPIAEALNIAFTAGLDLVEINPESKPPVCKILDYGRHKYSLQKKKKESKKKQVVATLKELQLNVGIHENDFNVKLEKLKEFLAKGLKVKIMVKLIGRQVNYPQDARDLLQKFYEGINGEAGGKIESGPKLEGHNNNNCVAIFAPVAAKIPTSSL
ncbi:Translation initiation factor IF-3 [Candidatus Hepatincolaceae symbiont of Richtersius coronifer]